MENPSDTCEWHTPPRYVCAAEATAADDVFDNARLRPDHPSFARKVDGHWETVTAGTFAAEVTRLAAGLVAAGVEPGDRVALMSATRYEWMLCDFAIWTVGAVTVPIYETSSAAQIAWILEDSGAVAAFVEDERCAGLVAEAGVAVRHVWRMDDGLGALMAGGADVPAETVRARHAALTSDSLATLVYTSGTTGRPKGCMITHGNLVSEARNVAAADGIPDIAVTEHTRILMFLPLAHVFARVVALVAVHNGAQLGFHGDFKTVPDELKTYRPTLILGVPRVFEKACNTARRTAEEGGHARLFRRAEKTAAAYSRALDTGGPGPLLRLRHLLYDRLVYAKLRAAMGGQARYACSGGAPLVPELGHFLRGAGITVLEGWGLTETTSGVTLNLPSAQRLGTVGRPVPGMSARIGADGEVLVKGAAVFRGYWRNEAATAEVFTPDGWLRTGDLGELTDGFIGITGRKKDLIITASGKNLAPAVLEDRLNAHWLIDQCLLVGDRLPYIAALISLDLTFLTQWLRERGKPITASLAELRRDPDLQATIQAAINEVNRLVSAAESIKKFRIISGPFVVGDELTPTQKLRREYVLTKLASEVEALYSSPA